MSGAPFLQVSDLLKTFGGVRVLSGVGFTITKGECIALVGPSGCGKTTTLRCIGGLEFPDAGEIRLEGELLAKGPNGLPPQARNLGMVFQSYSVWPHLTVFENVAFGLRLRKRPSDEIRARVTRTLELVNIAALAARKSHQLSGGQLQRVALARTLVVEPKLVLFDEPLSNLDAQLRAHMRAEIRALLKRLEMTAVYVTHDQTEASVVADRTAVMHEGRIQQIGAWSDLYFRPANRFVAEFMGAGNLLDATVEEQDAGGLRVRLGSGGTPGAPGAGAASLTLDRDRIGPAAAGVVAGQSVTVYAPREAVRIASGGGAGAFAGRIAQILPGPAVFEVVVDSDLGRLAAVSFATDAIPPVGAACSFDLSTDHLSIFSKDTSS
jgi:iron(III) transport system ATP-binding protein